MPDEVDPTYYGQDRKTWEPLVARSFTVRQDHVDVLEALQRKMKLRSASEALRLVLDKALSLEERTDDEA